MLTVLCYLDNIREINEALNAAGEREVIVVDDLESENLKTTLL